MKGKGFPYPFEYAPMSCREYPRLGRAKRAASGGSWELGVGGREVWREEEMVMGNKDGGRRAKGKYTCQMP